MSSRLQLSTDSGPQVRTWLANSGGRCRSVGTESQISDKIPKLEEISSPILKKRKPCRRQGKIRRACVNQIVTSTTSSDVSLVSPKMKSPAEDSVTSEMMKQKFALMASSSSDELQAMHYSDHYYEEAEERSLQRSSSVSNLNSQHPSMGVTILRRRHSLDSINDSEAATNCKKQQTSTWVKVKKMIYNRRESFKRNVHDFPESPQPFKQPSKKMKSKNPELVFCHPDMYDNTRVFSQSLNSIKTDQNQMDTSLLSPKLQGEELSHSLPSSPRGNPDSEMFFYEDNMMDGGRRKDTLNISTDSRDTEHHEAVSEIQNEFEQLKRSLSEEFNKKMSAWGQKKSPRDGGCQSVTDESQLSAEFRKKLEEWKRIKGSNEVGNNDVTVQLHQDRPELEFPSFLWHRPKDKTVKSPVTETKGSGAAVKIRARPAEQKTLIEDDLKPEFKLKVAEWEVQKAMAGHSNRTTEEISKLMPEDFNKKLREWEQLKVKPGEGCKDREEPGGEEKKPKKKHKSQEHWVKSKKAKNEASRGDVAGPEVGSFAWLDKELHKVDREKQRLERERIKTMERESRLLAMRQALGDRQQDRKEITVKTRAGEEFK